MENPNDGKSVTDSPAPEAGSGADPELQRWNSRYEAAEYIFGTQPNGFLAAQSARLRPGMTALCVADGEGRNSVWLARRGLAVTAFDFSPVAVAKARALAHEAGVAVDYRQSNVDDWDWSSKRYDVVVAIFVQFASPARRSTMFKGMVEALEPGGLLILQGYGPGQIEHGTGGPKQEENLYTESLLRESFAQLETVHLAAHTEIVDEGSAHHGLSALVDMVARRP